VIPFIEITFVIYIKDSIIVWLLHETIVILCLITIPTLNLVLYVRLGAVFLFLFNTKEIVHLCLSQVTSVFTHKTEGV
jgi:hypothetical protein